MSTNTARRLRRNQTTAEQRLWSRLRDRQLAGNKFKRQVPRGPFIVDFACLDSKLIIELDGGQHADPVRNEEDRRRSAWLQAEGYHVLRFWNHEVFENMDGVLATIIEALKDPPHPNPLPAGEREHQSRKLQIETRQMPKRSNPTDAELRLWSALRRRQLDGLRFRRQVPLGRFIVDFSCYDSRLVVELDGGQHAEQAEEDIARTQWLESRGFRVLRFWNNEVFENLDGVLTVIREAAATCRAP